MKESYGFEPMGRSFGNEAGKCHQQINFIIRPLLLQQQAKQGVGKTLSPCQVRHSCSLQHQNGGTTRKRSSSVLCRPSSAKGAGKEKTEGGSKMHKSSSGPKENGNSTSYFCTATPPKDGELINYWDQLLSQSKEERITSLWACQDIDTLALKHCEIKLNRELCDSNHNRPQTLDFTDKEDVDVDKVCRITTKCETSKVILGNCRLSPQDLEKLKKLKCPKLDISLNDLGSEEHTKGVVALLNSESIKKLVLNGCSLLKSQIDSIITHALKGRKQLNLEKLVLTGNPKMGVCDYQALAMLVNRGLKKLSISGCEVTDGHIEAFGAALDDDSKLAKLDVSYNECLTASGWEAVFRIVRQHGVEELNLSECRLRDKYLRLLIEEDNNQQVNLPKLQLGGNMNLTAEAIIEVARTVHVTDLQVDECSVSPQNLQKFLIGGYPELRTLDISEPHEIMNMARAKGIVSLMRCLRNLTCHYEEIPEDCRALLVNSAQELNLDLDLGDEQTRESRDVELMEK